MANLLEKIIVYGMAITLGGCAATGPNVRKNRMLRLSPKFGYEQIESDKPQSYSAYCPNGFVNPLTGICINLEPFLGPADSNYRTDCIPPYPIWEECPFPNNLLPQPQPERSPWFIYNEALYTDSADDVSVNKQSRCCCPPGVELPCCEITLRGRR